MFCSGQGYFTPTVSWNPLTTTCWKWMEQANASPDGMNKQSNDTLAHYWKIIIGYSFWKSSSQITGSVNRDTTNQHKSTFQREKKLWEQTMHTRQIPANGNQGKANGMVTMHTGPIPSRLEVPIFLHIWENQEIHCMMNSPLAIEEQTPSPPPICLLGKIYLSLRSWSSHATAFSIPRKNVAWMLHWSKIA